MPPIGQQALLRPLLHDRASDDGRRNFKKGETFSKVFKGIHDLELTYGESSLFLSGKFGTTSS